MNKTAVIAISLLLVTSGASAALIPGNMTINLNLGFQGIFEGGNDSPQQEEENNTYGKRVGGQSVHTETRENDLKEQRNSQEYRITEDTSEEQDDPLLKLWRSLFG